VRDSKGAKLLLAFSHYSGVAQSITAEVRAILDGLRYCLASGMNVNYIESDSHIVVNVLKNQSVVPWRISHWISKFCPL
jgi:ribonuclease HI